MLSGKGKKELHYFYSYLLHLLPFLNAFLRQGLYHHTCDSYTEWSLMLLVLVYKIHCILFSITTINEEKLLLPFNCQSSLILISVLFMLWYNFLKFQEWSDVCWNQFLATKPNPITMQWHFRSFIRQEHYWKDAMIKTPNCFLKEHFCILASHKCLPIKLLLKHSLKVKDLQGPYLNHKFGHQKQLVCGRYGNLLCLCSEIYSKLTHTSHG